MSRGRKHKEYLARAHAMGGHTTVPAGDTVTVLTALAERMSLGAIGKALGTSHNYVSRVISGDIKRMQPSRHAAIMALRDHQPNDTSHVSARGTARRLQALHALGYSFSRLEKEIDGYGVRSIKDVVYGRLSVLEAHHAVAVADAYERLSMRLPEATSTSELSGITRARNNAQRNGWLPPLAWDDIDSDRDHYIDLKIEVDQFCNEPDDIDEVLVERILGNDLSIAADASPAEREEVVRRWPVETGLSLAHLERETGWNVTRYVKRIRARDAA